MRPGVPLANGLCLSPVRPSLSANGNRARGVGPVFILTARDKSFRWWAVLQLGAKMAAPGKRKLGAATTGSGAGWRKRGSGAAGPEGSGRGQPQSPFVEGSIVRVTMENFL